MSSATGGVAGPPFPGHPLRAMPNFFRPLLTPSGQFEDFEDIELGQGQQTNGTTIASPPTTTNRTQAAADTARPNKVRYCSITLIVTSIADYTRKSHWYWILGSSAGVFYTVQLVVDIHNPNSTEIWHHLAFTVIVYGTAIFMVLEQFIAKYRESRRVKLSEIFISTLVVMLSIASWLLWSFRGTNPLLKPLGSYCYGLIEIILMLRFAYRSLIEKFEQHVTPQPQPHRHWVRDLETGHPNLQHPAPARVTDNVNVYAVLRRGETHH